MIVAIHLPTKPHIRHSVSNGGVFYLQHCYHEGNFSSLLAQPPAGSSLLFGALADSGRIKERKNGSYRMVLKGVDEIDWFTDRPDRFEGLWKPQKLIRKWESFFETSEPNAQASFKVGGERELITFEMFKPKFSNKKQRLSFKIDAEIINDRESDLVTGLKSKALDEVTLFIDDALVEDALHSCDLVGLNLGYANMSGANLAKADLTRAILIGTNLSDANLTDASLHVAKLLKANLSGADLSKVELSYAALSGANLTDANLSYAKLLKANLTGTDLTGARWDNTVCPNGTLNSGSSPCTAEQLNLALFTLSPDRLAGFLLSEGRFR